MRKARRLPLIATLLTLVGWCLPAWAATEVDLALVLAVDISNSMDPEEQELQRAGFIEAFRSPIVHDAIRSGTLGQIAVVYMEWAGTPLQKVVVPWTVIATSEDAVEFAERLGRAPTQRAPRTSISGAIDFSVRLLEESGVEPIRQAIDISGDGANNQGRLVTQARNDALARGITINGLPIMLNRSYGYFDVRNLDLYYRDCVIGGPGAFMVPVRERSQFVNAIKTKIIREIASNETGEVVKPQPAQLSDNTACLTGDIRDWDLRR
jgi:hypothetical protein